MKNLGKRPALFNGRKKRQFFILLLSSKNCHHWNFILLYDYLFSNFATEFLKFLSHFHITEIYSLPLFTVLHM